MKTVKELFAGLPVTIKGKSNTVIRGIAAHSKRVKPKDLFICRKGVVYDGNLFAREAILAGASALLTEIYNPSLSSVCQIITDRVDHLESEIVHRFYGDVTKPLFSIGITGSNGKTTTAHLIQQLYQSFHVPFGLIGTIKTDTGHSVYQSEMTTYDIVRTHQLLKEIQSSHCKGVVMEVSSHALDQKRIEYLKFDQVIFTNLSHEHLDYHKTMHAYAQAKLQLFTETYYKKNGLAIINADDPRSGHFIERYPGSVVTVGIDTPADYNAILLGYTKSHMKMEIQCHGQSYPLEVPFYGKMNAYNVLCAIASVIEHTQDPIRAIQNAHCLCLPEGRQQRLHAKGVDVFIDFAHSPGAIKEILVALTPLTKGRLFCVFGCGGDRDKEKRPLMGDIVSQLADYTIVTSDNPRTENPDTIIEDIVVGVRKKETLSKIPNRKEAIARAIHLAKVGDIVVICGKGHEKTQEIMRQFYAFDDALIAQEMLKEKKVHNVEMAHD